MKWEYYTNSFNDLLYRWNGVNFQASRNKSNDWDNSASNAPSDIDTRITRAKARKQYPNAFRK